MVKALILKGDKTTHGGTVLNGFSDYTIQGIPVAGVGHLVACPLCKGVFPIVQGYGGLTVNGVFVALDGHVTACGAKLIPSQHEEVVDDGGGGVIGAVAQAVLQQEPEQPEQTQYASLSDDQRSMINDGVYRPDQDQGGIAQTAAEEDDLAPGEVRGETGREETLPEWSNENSYNTLFNEASELAKKDGFRYDVARDQNKPYTQDDVNAVQRDVEALKKGEYWSQRLQKAEQESQNTPNKSYLQFENFDNPLAPTDPSQNQDEIPQKAEDVLKRAEEKGSPFPGYPGGRTFNNIPEPGAQKLPEKDADGNLITYQEWDTDPRPPKKTGGRNSERVITGSDGSAYYTSRHYKTFNIMRKGK